MSRVAQTSGRGRDAQTSVAAAPLDADDLRLELRVAPVGVLDELEFRGGRPKDEDVVRFRERLGDLAVVVLILRCPVPVVRSQPPVELRVRLR